MRIDFVLDTVCPWCYVGKRRLEQALARAPEPLPEVTYRTFMLNPDMPAGPRGPQRTANAEDMANLERNARMIAAVRDAGASVGISFKFDHLSRTPQSADTHRLLQLAQKNGLGDAMLNALFRAYFEQGADVGNRETLTDIALSAGLARDAIEETLASQEAWHAVFAENARMRRIGVSGVPCFIINDTHAISGAQEPEILLRMLQIADDNPDLPPDDWMSRR